MTSVARRRDPDDSGEYSDTSQDIEHNNSGNEGGQHESDYDSQRSDSERSEGDPEREKQEAERRVDDDEDRSNPQYIPKRGTFYEHDDRTADGGEESNKATSEPASEKKEGSETPADRRRPPRKSDTLNKWSHDKYNENEQVPKSRDELVAIYGYDIRNEDAPPHARRNRRYGRGPNKYTRTWEDEEAYKRQVAQTPQRKPPSPADFPELNAVNKPGRKPRPRQRSKSQPASNDSSESGSQLRRNASIKMSNPKQKPVKPNLVKPGLKQGVNLDRSKDKIQIPENLTITTTVTNNNQGQPQRKVNAAVAQQRPVPTEQNKKKPIVTQPPLQSNAAKQPPQQQQQQQKPPSQQLAQQQPQQPQKQATAGAESRGGSKRYSDLRQRPLAETYAPQQKAPQQQKPPTQTQQTPPPQQQPTQPPPQQQQQQTQPPPQQQQQPQQHRYHGEFVGGTQPQPHQGSPGPQTMHPQQIMRPVHRNAVTQPQHGPSPPHQTLQQPQHAQQQVRLGILEQQQIVQHPHHTMHNMPQPHAIGQLQPAQGYAPPAMMPAQYMQQGGSGGVFGATPMYQPPAAYPHQLYQHHNYVSAAQGTQAGGVTYYSCAEQELPPRQPRRPTAAIPIVRPAHPERPANSSEKDNIDRIVENMFVRKPWPAHGVDAPKDKAQDNRNSQEPQSKEPSQPNSLTSSSISTDSKPEKTEKTERTESENPDSAEA
ncbi:putative mediator of RNA polymerase II transcription subunit 12 [Bicyclus anynana]|uniref:Protein CASC3 n=1 Tax=Bicyclus anynana TaxID=110368 RepID=A0A6J1MNQ0_BICAN|nr:putative mediator of RNA polymerase II transcription subunit 12 [Bicyclus anynana]